MGWYIQPAQRRTSYAMGDLAMLIAFFLTALAVRSGGTAPGSCDPGARLDQLAHNLKPLASVEKCRLHKKNPLRLPILQTQSHPPMPLPVILEAGNWAGLPERVKLSHGDLRGGRNVTTVRGAEAQCVWQVLQFYYKREPTLSPTVTRVF